MPIFLSLYPILLGLAHIFPLSIATTLPLFQAMLCIAYFCRVPFSIPITALPGFEATFKVR